jgi:hypothetical protein
MRRLETVRTEDMREVVQIATELFQREQGELEAAKQRQGLVEAAAELDLPAEYLERAAAQLHAQRVAEIRERRARRTSVFAVLGLAIGLWGGWRVFNPPPPDPALYDFNTAPTQQWVLERNPETEAVLGFESEADRGGVAAVTIERFGIRAADGTYYANLNSSDPPATLRGYRSVSFRVRGEGLPHVRLYLEAGPTERWRSPELPVGDTWQEQRLDLKQFEYQTRRSPSDTWRRDRYRGPDRIERLSFKVGHFVNDVGDRGRIFIDDLRFE